MNASVPSPSPKVRQGLLPGMAAIALFLFAVASINALMAVKGVFGVGAPRVGVLLLCLLLFCGCVGILRLKRWGWALVTGASLLISLGFLFLYFKSRIPTYLIQGLLPLCFFLYLAQSSVRERTH